ncbi:MAG: ABC transporter permease [Crocinitomicaceae bacterium]|nr:ABC transporter permease [Crocinitomicaceae bacterium]
MSKISLIIKREFSTRVRKGGFITITLLVPFLIVGAITILALIGQTEEKHYKVLIADPSDLCEGEIYVKPGTQTPATFYFYQDMLYVEDFINQPRFQDYDMMVALDDEVITNKTVNIGYRIDPVPSARVYIQKKIESRLEEYFARQNGISMDVYREVRQPMKVNFQDLENDEIAKTANRARILGFLLSVFIFLFITIYSAMVMRSVLEEKTSRIVEIVVSSVKPFQLLMGKIIGVGLVGLVQFFTWILITAGLLMLMRSFIFPDITTPEMVANLQEQGITPGMSEFDLLTYQNDFFNLLFNQVNWSLLLTLFVVFFIGGYLIYASLFAMVGAASDSEADTQQLIFPVLIPLIFVLMLAIFMLINPGGSSELWFSQIPFSSPIIMLQRVAAGTVSLWEVLMAIGILILTFILLTKLAAKVYRVGILMYGKKASWREIMRWMKQ